MSNELRKMTFTHNATDSFFFFHLFYPLSLHASSHETAALDLDTNLKAVLVYWRVAHMNFPPLDLSVCFFLPLSLD